jgi:hypothetical protein
MLACVCGRFDFTVGNYQNKWVFMWGFIKIFLVPFRKLLMLCFVPHWLVRKRLSGIYMGTYLYCSHSVKWQGTYGATCITGVAGDGTHSYAPAPARARACVSVAVGCVALWWRTLHLARRRKAPCRRPFLFPFGGKESGIDTRETLYRYRLAMSRTECLGIDTAEQVYRYRCVYTRISDTSSCTDATLNGGV